MALLPIIACDSPRTASRTAAPASTPEDAARAALRDVPLGHVTSRDQHGAARFVMGALDATPTPLGLTSEKAARVHLARHAELLGLSDGVVRGAVLHATHDLPGGASIVQLTQSVGGVPVFRARANIVLNAAQHLASIATTLHPAATATMPPAFSRTGDTALANAYLARFGRPTTTLGAPRLLESSSKKVLFAIGSRLVPAHHVEILTREIDTSDNEGWGYVIADDDGRTLHSESLTAHDAFTYRVWADATGNHIPMDGPAADYTPHPTGLPDRSKAGAASPILVTMEGFNKNPNNLADPWLLPTDTFTFGNNVRAYTDRDQNGNAGDGYDAADVRADLTAALTFDRTYDVTKAPNDSVEQEKASVTQIFYTTNWLHDFWYDSGFNEVSGVAQLSNFARGGVEGDPLRAEAQDSADHGQSNNANMNTPTDGTSPRMQMYVWSGAPNQSITTAPTVAFPDGYGSAGFGPQTFDVTGALSLTTPNNACAAITTNVTGKIAVIDRGTCSFVSKVAAAQAAGAIGVIIVNNAAGHAAPGMGGAGAVAIGVLSISLEDGATLKTAIAGGAVTAELKRGPSTLLDGTIDNTVVAHEWGHYLHHRLVQCGSSSCGGMSEGWADFDALMLVIKAGDAMQGGTVFPLAQYATGGITRDNEYFGIRRAPYSTSFAKNPFTFGHVRRASTLPTGAPLTPASADMSEVHNVGEIWAETLFEGYANMIIAGTAASQPFDVTKRRMADAVVAGMKAAPTEPTFTEQRDAVLSTVWAMGRAGDFTSLAMGFAKRGLGVGAIAPPIGSTDLNEAVENFDFKGNLAFVDGKLDDLARTCDGDGILDSGEVGTLTLRVKNAGWLRLSHTTVQVLSPSPHLQILPGTASVAAIDPYGVATVTVAAKMLPGLTAREVISVGAQFTDVDSYSQNAGGLVPVLLNADDVAATSANDDVESSRVVWTQTHGTMPAAVWARIGDAANHLWHGADLPTPTDERLVSPSLVVGAGAFTIKFSHRFQFENAGGAYYDGGVLEVSPDDGVTWNDVTTYVNPAYPQTLDNSAPDNVLNGRKAWAGDSTGYPAYTDVVLDLGTQLAGKTIKVRFRLGSDSGGSSTGWDIDNLQFGGITNKPFASIVDNRVACPLSDAGTGNTDSGTTSDSGADSGSTSDGGFVSPDSGTTGSDSGAGAVAEDDSGTLGGGACAASPIRQTSQGVGLLAGLLALVLGRRRRR